MFSGIDAISIPPKYSDSTVDHSELRRSEHAQYNIAKSFGVLYACAHIYTVWNATFPPHEIRNDVFLLQGVSGDGAVDDDRAAADGSVEHGVVVIDMRLGQSRGLLDPVSLIRILTAPNVLPPAAFGGVVIANAHVTAPLLFANVRVHIPLAFNNVVFSGGDYRRAYIGDKPLDASVAIAKSTFDRSLTFAGSAFCGTFRIIEARLDDILEFRPVTKPTIGFAQSDCDPAELLIDSTTSHTMRVRDVHFDSTLTRNSLIETFDVLYARINQDLLWYESQLGSLWIFESSFGELEVRQNQVSRNLYIQNPIIRNEKGRFVISYNQVGAGFAVEGFRAGSVHRNKNFDLRGNEVRNGSRLCISHLWQGKIDLSGSSFGGKLLIDLSSPDLGKDEADSCLSLNDADFLSKLRCDLDISQFPDDNAGRSLFQDDTSPRQKVIYSLYCSDDRMRFEGEFCAPQDSSSKSAGKGDRVAGQGFAIIDLSASDIGSLHWSLPLSCKWRWVGFGSAYKLWEPPAYSNLTEWTAFKAWRTSLADLEPSPIFQMAKYLADKGDHVGSRQMLVEAKRLNYARECAPSERVWNCAIRPLTLPGGYLQKDNFQTLYSATVGDFNGLYSATVVNLNRAGWGLIQTARAGDSLLRNQHSEEESTGEKENQGFGNFSGTLNQVWRPAQLLLLAPEGYGATPERAIQLVVLTLFGFF